MLNKSSGYKQIDNKICKNLENKWFKRDADQPRIWLENEKNN